MGPRGEREKLGSGPGVRDQATQVARALSEVRAAAGRIPDLAFGLRETLEGTLDRIRETGFRAGYHTLRALSEAANLAHAVERQRHEGPGKIAEAATNLVTYMNLPVWAEVAREIEAMSKTAARRASPNPGVLKTVGVVGPLEREISKMAGHLQEVARKMAPALQEIADYASDEKLPAALLYPLEDALELAKKVQGHPTTGAILQAAAMLAAALEGADFKKATQAVLAKLYTRTG